MRIYAHTSPHDLQRSLDKSKVREGAAAAQELSLLPQLRALAHAVDAHRQAVYGHAGLSQRQQAPCQRLPPGCTQRLASERSQTRHA